MMGTGFLTSIRYVQVNILSSEFAAQELHQISKPTSTGKDVLIHSSKSFPCGFWAWTSCDAAIIPAPLFQPLLGTELQLAIEIWTGFLSMDEVAKSTSYTAFSRIQPTTSFPKVGNG